MCEDVVRVAGSDLYVAQAHPGIEHGRHERVAQIVRVHPRLRSMFCD